MDHPSESRELYVRDEKMKITSLIMIVCADLISPERERERETIKNGFKFKVPCAFLLCLVFSGVAEDSDGMGGSG